MSPVKENMQSTCSTPLKGSEVVQLAGVALSYFDLLCTDNINHLSSAELHASMIKIEPAESGNHDTKLHGAQHNKRALLNQLPAPMHRSANTREAFMALRQHSGHSICCRGLPVLSYAPGSLSCIICHCLLSCWRCGGPPHQCAGGPSPARCSRSGASGGSAASAAGGC